MNEMVLNTRHVSGWNEAIEAAAKECEWEADKCEPGSPAEMQHWPFALLQMAKRIRKLKIEIPSGDKD